MSNTIFSPDLGRKVAKRIPQEFSRGERFVTYASVFVVPQFWLPISQ